MEALNRIVPHCQRMENIMWTARVWHVIIRERDFGPCTPYTPPYPTIHASVDEPQILRPPIHNL
jgi:hypothetical protein